MLLLSSILNNEDVSECDDNIVFECGCLSIADYSRDGHLDPDNDVLFKCPICNTHLVLVCFKPDGRAYDCMGKEINPEITSICKICFPEVKKNFSEKWKSIHAKLGWN